MKSGLLKNVGIRSRVMLLALIPVIFASCISIYHTTNKQLTLLQEALIDRGQLLALHLSSASEFAIFSGNTELLNNLASSALQEKETYDVVIKGIKGEILAYASKRGSRYVKPSSLLEFTEAVNQTVLDINDFNEYAEEAPNHPSQLGTITVRFTKHFLYEKQKRIYEEALLILLFIILICSLFGWYLGEKITAPILALTSAVTKLQKGKLETRVRLNSSYELNTLGDGFNMMATSIENSHEQLVREVHSATSELQNSVQELKNKNIELDQAKQHALKLGEAKSQFLATMSHEIRTPASGVIGYSELLSRTDLSALQKDYLHSISGSADQLLNIIDDILIFSKLNTDHIKLEDLEFNIRDLVEQTLQTHAPVAHEKGVELVGIFDNDVSLSSKGDPIRISQIMSNLIGNAVKFTHSGTVSIKVFMADQGDSLAFTIKDTGIGIPTDKLSAIFQPFSQAENSISRRFGGTGLGLSIVYKLVEIMKGSIDVVSEENKGTEFTITLPTLRGSADKNSTPRLSGKKTLILEPHPLLRRTVRNDLIYQGATTLLDRQYDGSIERMNAMILKHGSVDAIILGISPSDSHTPSLEEQLNSIRKHYTGPVIAMASAIMYSEDNQWSTDPNVHCLSRPYRLDRLIDTLTTDAPKLQARQTSKNIDVHELAQRKVLIAEDTGFNRELITALLSKLGMEVTAVEEGKSAIAYASENAYDLILLDIHMPILGGVETATAIKASGANQNTPLIALTADVFFEEEHPQTHSLFNQVLHKPIREKTLANVLAEYIGLKEGMSEQRKPYNETSLVSEISEELKPKLIKDLRLYREQLEQAVLNNDKALFDTELHKLFGLSGYFQLNDIHQLVQCLTEEAKEQDFVKLRGLVDEVLNQIDLFIRK